MHNDQPPEISGIEEIRIVEPDDYVSRHARLHREAGRRTTPLELENWTPKKAARVPRDSEPCPLWVFFVMAAFLVACFAVMGASALHAARMGAEAAMAYADALIPALVMWIGDVIRWVAQ